MEKCTNKILAKTAPSDSILDMTETGLNQLNDISIFVSGPWSQDGEQRSRWTIR